MPCISGAFRVADGILLPVTVVQSGGGVDALKLQPSPPIVYGLVDLGASHTCVSTSLAECTCLEQVSMIRVRGVHGLAPTPQYAADLIVRFESIPVVLPRMTVLGFASDAQSSYQILIGRDVISRSTLIISRDGRFTFRL
ncbi:MAG TPA: hypothetical protein VF265_09160 [Nevskiaceae bacterium]